MFTYSIRRDITHEVTKKVTKIYVLGRNIASLQVVTRSEELEANSD